MKIPFILESEESLILVPTLIENEEGALVLDTGASHTIIDLTKLLLLGYRVSDNIGTVKFETAKGEVDAFVFNIKYLKALGISKKNITVCSYDFLGNNVLTEIDGVLGLDFFKDTELFINFKKFIIELKK